MKKKIFFYCGDGNSLINFRGHLIKKFIKNQFDVYANCPNITDQNYKILTSWGVKLVSSDIQRKNINVISSLIELFQLISNLKKIKPNIIFSYTHKPLLVGALAGYLSRVPMIVSLVTGTGHLFDANNLRTKTRKFFGLKLFKIALKISNKIIFQNPDDLKLFLDLNLATKDNCSIVNGSGVDLDAFPYTPLPHKKTFLCLARLIASKGLIEYANAARSIKQTYPEYNFLLGGPIDHHSDSISLEDVLSWKKEYGVEYIGNISNPAEAIQQCDIYVLLSYNEGTPRSVLEALSIGRPIITTDTSGCRETVIHGKNGYLATVKDYCSSAYFMEEIIKSDLNAMSMESRRLAELKYDVHKVNNQIFRILEIDA